jgi:hypothetical protein
MPVTWVVFPDRPRAELMLTDPYTFSEFENAMHAIVDRPLSRDFRILIDRRRGGRFSDSFVSCAVNLFRAHEAHLAGTRAAVLVSKTVSVVLPNLRIGRFHLRAFHDAAEAEQWLHSGADSSSMHRRAAGQ